jgi:hypothetical protein
MRIAGSVPLPAVNAEMNFTGPEGYAWASAVDPAGDAAVTRQNNPIKSHWPRVLIALSIEKLVHQIDAEMLAMNAINK